MNYTATVYYGDTCLGTIVLDRFAIYERMKQEKMKHFIHSCCYMDDDGHRHFITTDGFHKWHKTDESFEDEIAFLEAQGFNYFDVTHYNG